jgi:glutathione peroxidase-family protein
MKYNLFFLGIIILGLKAGSSIYDISTTLVDGTQLNMSDFQNKRLIISEFDAVNPDINWLEKLDSIQNSDSTFQVVAVPANDFSGLGNDSLLASLRDSLSLKIKMLRSSFVRKSAGDSQELVFKWLTDVNANTHFDVDADVPNQLFIISPTGVLYSVLSSDVSSDVLSQILIKDIEQTN